ncbi:fructosamine kinase family protein [Paenibacillus alkalitolerans]|uniref:fructosamine kinase family protein n=1 Tax=Paenibacillus alkalitolerans TaxID=2799335 RepID=UPI0018F57B98|nr:fructosamine kinase family protein [Paenibacillus alkalitolerans]
MIIILSGDYINQELKAEFGSLPPCMLPIENKRLYELQISIIRKSIDEDVVISLPQNYKILEQDLHRLEQLKVDIIFVPEGISLADSLLYVINRKGSFNEAIKVLHGDTLIENIPESLNTIGISSTKHEYDWEFVGGESFEKDLVWCGYFSFSNIKLLVQSLETANGDFIRAIREYETLNPMTKEHIITWYDLGHLNTYFNTRAKKTTERSFNSLDISQGYVKKTGTKTKKIKAEYEWYRNIPWEIKTYTPQVYEYGYCEMKPYYILEYLPLTPLNELYVYGENNVVYWERIFSHCNTFFELCENKIEKPIEEKSINIIQLKKMAENLFEEKTYSRLEEFSRSTGFDLQKELILNGQACLSILKIAEECIQTSKKDSIIPAVLHGDFCFSNILYSSRDDQIKVIDPRGMSDKQFSIYGDLRYDIAKLTHSVIGLYDYIIAGAMDFKINNDYEMDLKFYQKNRVLDIQKQFSKQRFMKNHITINQIMPITILLFISMLPLHSDNPIRQRALLSNAIRLFLLFEEQFL